MLSKRAFYLSVLVVSSGLLGFGYFLQFVRDLEPCPLCIFQRLAYIAIALVALIAVGHGPGQRWRRIYSACIGVFALTGAGIALRQVWLQHLPADLVPECGPGLDYMLDILPLADAVKMVFRGSGECAQVDWTFLSFSIAEWSLACFLLITAAATAPGS